MVSVLNVFFPPTYFSYGEREREECVLSLVVKKKKSNEVHETISDSVFFFPFFFFFVCVCVGGCVLPFFFLSDTFLPFIHVPSLYIYIYTYVYTYLFCSPFSHLRCCFPSFPLAVYADVPMPLSSSFPGRCLLFFFFKDQF